ncbi:MAG: hypothetical protein IJ043_11170 [Clostridia bacterium]|nr:hypothetical protein [Clostridia bacterium]
MFGSRLEVRRFEESVLQYEAQPVVQGKILLYGHSLFTRCSSITTCVDNPRIEEELRMKDGSQAIVNHGFGTSSADDLLYYYSRLVRPYQPRALVLATAANDFGMGYTPAEVMDTEARLIDWFKADFPGAPVYCMNYIPTLTHKGMVDLYTHARTEYNRLLKNYCKRAGCIYVPLEQMPFFYRDPADAGDYDKVRSDVFVGDRVHLNSAGYRYFIECLRELFGEGGLL